MILIEKKEKVGHFINKSDSNFFIFRKYYNYPEGQIITGNDKDFNSLWSLKFPCSFPNIFFENKNTLFIKNQSIFYTIEINTGNIKTSIDKVIYLDSEYYLQRTDEEDNEEIQIFKTNSQTSIITLNALNWSRFFRAGNLFFISNYDKSSKRILNCYDLSTKSNIWITEFTELAISSSPSLHSKIRKKLQPNSVIKKKKKALGSINEFYLFNNILICQLSGGDHRLIAFDISSGEILWKKDHVFKDGVKQPEGIYFFSMRKNYTLNLLNPQNGELKIICTVSKDIRWEFQYSHQFQLQKETFSYVVQERPEIVFWNRNTGELIQKISVPLDNSTDNGIINYFFNDEELIINDLQGNLYIYH